MKMSYLVTIIPVIRSKVGGCFGSKHDGFVHLFALTQNKGLTILDHKLMHLLDKMGLSYLHQKQKRKEKEDYHKTFVKDAQHKIEKLYKYNQ